MRPLFALTAALLAAAAPAFAQTAPAPPAPAAAPAAGGPSTALLDSLVGKTHILGITKTSGRRYLCRLSSGDHGVYLAQIFHFAGPPKVTKETKAPAQAAPRETTRYRTIGSGRNRMRVPITTEQPGRVTKGRTVEVKAPTTIPDIEAVKLLLSGVAGANRHPEEVSESRDILAAADIKFVQELAPPAAKSAVPASTPAAPANAWTMTTLWPLAKDAAPAETPAPAKTPAPAETPAPEKRTRRSRKTPV